MELVNQLSEKQEKKMHVVNYEEEKLKLEIERETLKDTIFFASFEDMRESYMRVNNIALQKTDGAESSMCAYYKFRFQEWLHKRGLDSQDKKNLNTHLFLLFMTDLEKEKQDLIKAKEKADLKAEQIDMAKWKKLNSIEIINVDSKYTGLNLINAAAEVLPLFLEAEKRAFNGKTFFPSKTRCAAWCVLLKEKGYLLTTEKEPNKLLEDFAMLRYKMDIKSALASGKKKENEILKHINKRVKRQASLRSCF